MALTLVALLVVALPIYVIYVARSALRQNTFDSSSFGVSALEHPSEAFANRDTVSISLVDSVDVADEGQPDDFLAIGLTTPTIVLGDYPGGGIGDYQHLE